MYITVQFYVVLRQEGPTREEGSCTIIAGGQASYVGKAGPAKRTTCNLLNRRWAIAKLTSMLRKIGYLILILKLVA